MADTQNLELLALRLKLGGTRIKKRAFLSTGNLLDKQHMLPGARSLADLGVQIFATAGTSRFLTEHGVQNSLVRKIAEGGEDNVLSLLEAGGFDLVVNVLTGDSDYDEASDARMIRTLAIKHGIPLITDVTVAVGTIERLVRQLRVEQEHSHKRQSMGNYFATLVHTRGGYANYHAHADKALQMRPEYLNLGHVRMQEKWKLSRSLKEAWTPEDLRDRIASVVRHQIDQGVTHFRSMFDADSTAKLMSVEAALDVKREYAGQIVFEIATQALEGVIEPEARKWYERACGMVDVIGGLPSKDRPRPEKHLDIIMSIAKEQGKRLDVHVDQENNPEEDETKLLALKTVEHGMEGRVSAVHAISLACKPDHERKEVCRMLKDAGISVIVCPSAALSMEQLGKVSRLHNSLAPVVDLLGEGVQVVLGVDNIQDIYMPFVDGDMYTEVRFLMEACRFYDADRVADMACDKSLFGQKALATAA